MFNKPFVILDLETSGTDPNNDEIIEVAMIRYENMEEVDRYESLIKIDKALSKIVSLITNINDEDLDKDGKDSADVFPKISRMLDGAYLIAHNVNFDFSFLKENNIKMNILGQIDTMELAQVLMSNSTSYSLESLSDDLNIIHKNKHRAMGDVEATLELFKALISKVESIPSFELMNIQNYIKRCDWRNACVFDKTNLNIEHVINSFKKAEFISTNNNNLSVRRDSLEVDEILSENGILQNLWEDYESRPQQFKMSKAVMSAFQNNYHLICEAPTGVGKSLAYLIPALNIAIKNKTKVVISTNTINLQDQLFEKDIPLLKNIYKFKNPDFDFNVSLLKGRKHYLCLRRFSKFKEKDYFSDTEIKLLLKILFWQTQSTTQDSSEIYLNKSERMIWDFELYSDKNDCSPQKCSPYGTCYLHKARKDAENADLIIVNHALLCSDLDADNSILPKYNYLVIDEAHNFENAVTDAFSIKLKQDNFLIPFNIIRSYLLEVKKRFGETLFSNEILLNKVTDLLENYDSIPEDVDKLFNIISMFIGKHVQESTYVEHLLVDQNIQSLQDWADLTVSVDSVSISISSYIKALKSFIDLWNLSLDEDTEESEIFTSLFQEYDAFKSQLNNLKQFFSDNKEFKNIRWMTLDLNASVSLMLAPYVPGDKIKENLYKSKKSIIFTSATLGINIKENYSEDSEKKSFSYFKTILNLDDSFEELVLSSPFDFENQAFVIIPSDAENISSQNSFPQILNFFSKLIDLLRGNILGLFTSYRMIEKLYLELALKFKGSGINLLAQRISGGRNKVMKSYLKNADNSVLFGTASFWEGVDIKGKDLSTLVIHKLPFDVPSDPICKARSQMFNNGFMEYSVPRAVLKFRQGFGRLIRSKKDYGVMVILDNRVITKRYGSAFIDSLPDYINIEKMPMSQIPDTVKEWLDLNK